MEEGSLSRIDVRDVRAAAVFTNPRQRRILMWFAGEPKSIGEAAATLNIDLRQIHYHVRKFVGLKLLRETGARVRPGRPIKLYSAVGSAFFVPNELTGKGFGDDLARELRTSLASALVQEEGGMLFVAEPGGAVRGKLVGGPHQAQGAAEMWRVLRLLPEEVTALHRDLADLLDRYQRGSVGAGGQVYLVHAAFAQRADYRGTTDNDPKLRTH